MSDPISQFAEALAAAGYVPKGGKIIADDEWHPAFINGEKTPHGAYSMKIVDGDFAIGCFFNRKDKENKTDWHSKSDKKMSAEDRKRIKKLMAEQEKQREAKNALRYASVSRRITRAIGKMEKADKHPYLGKKGIEPHGVKYRRKGNELIIPGYGVDGKTWTLQRILPNGKKYMFPGGRKKGSYFAFATADEDKSIFLICEGYATGASIREATGKPTVAAFDAGNIQYVIADLKKKYPSSKFVICADSDAFTFYEAKKPKDIDAAQILGNDPRWQEWADKGYIWNVGIEKAKEAAVKIGGAAVIWPEFVSRETKPTDFNDLKALEGLEAVRKRIETVLISAPADAGEGLEAPCDAPDQHPSPDAAPMPEDMQGYERDYELPEGDYGLRFKVLGYNNCTYYYFPYKARQIVALSASGHTLQNLLQLEELDKWMDKFGAGGEVSEKKVSLYAANALMQLAMKRGVFQEEDRVRGCGAWLDNGRLVLHCGDKLYVNGKETPFDKLDTEFVYVAASKLMRPAAEPLTSKEGFRLRQICEAPTWENKLSGTLLAGWLVVAPVCAALDFRPHGYLTGESGSGKSTVLNKIIKPVLGRFSLNVDGKTTEPSVRQQMGYNSRPLVFDEAEKSLSLPAVIDLARLASTGGIVKKFGQPVFNARFCALFSAINPPVSDMADESRMAFFILKKNHRATAEKEYEDLLKAIEDLITPDFSNRLLARTLAHMSTLLANIKTFEKAARHIMKDPRTAAKIGTMLAGLYLLSRTDAVTLDAAKEWINKHDWKDYRLPEGDGDPLRFLQHLSTSIIGMQTSHGRKDISVGDLVLAAHQEGDNCPENKLLRYYGMAVKGSKLYVASRSQNLAKLLRDTDWEDRWSRTMGDLPGAEKVSVFYFSAGNKTSAVSLPVNLFMEEKKQAQEELPNLAPPDDYMQEIPF